MKPLPILIPSALLFLSLLSCNKEEKLPCYECISRQIITNNLAGTAIQLPGYPDTTYKSEEICNMTVDQIRVYELQYGGSKSLLIPSNIYPQGVLMQAYYSMECKKK